MIITISGYSALLNNIYSCNALELSDNSLLSLNKSSSVIFNPAADSVKDSSYIGASLISILFNNPAYFIYGSSVKTNINMGGGIAYFESDEFPEIDIYGNTLSNINYYESLFYFNISKLIRKTIGIGITPKVLHQHPNNNSVYTIDFDIGIETRTLTFFNKYMFSYGISVKNILSYYSVIFNMANTLFDFSDFSILSSFSVLTHKFNNFSLNPSIFIKYRKNLIFMLGYKINSYSIAHLSLGINIENIKNFDISYSIIPSSFETRHYLSIIFKGLKKDL